MLSNLPLTKIRIIIAKILYRVVSIFKKDKQKVERGGINYELDLREGIDFSIFLMGNFQKYISDSPLIKLPDNYSVIDVGANIGQMTLRFAQKEDCERVISFEPTDFASAKLKKNISLNPELAKKITVEKSFVSDTSENVSALTAYASWKLSGNKNDEIHPLHLGSVTEANATPSVTLDDYLHQANINNLGLIKIDTDGNEPKVLRGAIKSIKKYKPYVIFEAGLYIIEEAGGSFEDYFEIFKDLNFTLFDLKSEKKITLENYKNIIPQNSTTDILAVLK